jgi:hypothetical protein
MLIDFVFLTFSTSLDVGVNEGLESRPPIEMGNCMISTQLARVSSGVGVVVAVDNTSS